MAVWIRKSFATLSKNVRFRRKTTPCGKVLLEDFVPKGFTTSQTHVLCANFVKCGCPAIGKLVRHLPDKKKQKIGSRCRSRFCADRTQNLSGPAPVNMLGAPQISSKSVHIRRSYSRTRERRSNAPQSVSNTRKASAYSPSNKENSRSTAVLDGSSVLNQCPASICWSRL